MLAALGVPLVLLGALVTAMGLERAVTFWNDQMALLLAGLALAVPSGRRRARLGGRRPGLTGGGGLATPDGQVDQ